MGFILIRVSGGCEQLHGSYLWAVVIMFEFIGVGSLWVVVA